MLGLGVFAVLKERVFPSERKMQQNSFLILRTAASKLASPLQVACGEREPQRQGLGAWSRHERN